MSGEADWLSGDAREDASPKEKAVQQARAVDFAQLYLCFVRDPQARELLAHWVESVENRDVPPSASHQEYAYWEGRRAFIRGIQRQIALAQKGTSIV